MMSPRLPLAPNFPRDPPTITSPNPFHLGQFSSTQLPPPVQYAQRNYNTLTPISGLPGGGSTVQQYPHASHSQCIAYSSPPYPSQLPPDIHSRWPAMNYDHRALPERPPAFSSPTSSSAYSSPASFSYDPRSEYTPAQRFSNDHSTE